MELLVDSEPKELSFLGCFSCKIFCIVSRSESYWVVVEMLLKILIRRLLSTKS